MIICRGTAALKKWLRLGQIASPKSTSSAHSITDRGHFWPKLSSRAIHWTSTANVRESKYRQSSSPILRTGKRWGLASATENATVIYGLLVTKRVQCNVKCCVLPQGRKHPVSQQMKRASLRMGLTVRTWVAHTVFQRIMLYFLIFILNIHVYIFHILKAYLRCTLRN